MKGEPQSRVEITVDISLALGKKLSRVGRVLTERWGKPCSLEDALDAMAEVTLHKLEPPKKPPAKSSGPRSKLVAPPKRAAKTPVPSHLKLAALRRDRNQCTHAHETRGRCGNKKRVDIFPVRELSGRAPTLRDLGTLCHHHSPKAG